jgi:hypothetical protein
MIMPQNRKSCEPTIGKLYAFLKKNAFGSGFFAAISRRLLQLVGGEQFTNEKKTLRSYDRVAFSKNRLARVFIANDLRPTGCNPKAPRAKMPKLGSTIK